MQHLHRRDAQSCGDWVWTQLLWRLSGRSTEVCGDHLDKALRYIVIVWRLNESLKYVIIVWRLNEALGYYMVIVWRLNEALGYYMVIVWRLSG